MEINKEYSFKDFTGIDLSEKPLTGIVKGSCFAADLVNTDRFHPNSSCVFVNCNLDNCNIPTDCKVDGGTNKRIMPQIDGEDWEVDKIGKPQRPVNYKQFRKLGISEHPEHMIRAEKDPVTLEVKMQLKPERFR